MSLVPYKVTAIPKTDPTGNNVSPLASVSIIKSGGGYAQLWDDEAGTIARANPFQVDANGERQVWLNGGEYNVSVAGGQSWDVKLTGGSDILSIENVAALSGYEPIVGQLYRLKEYNLGTGKGGGDLLAKSGVITPNNVTTFASGTAGVYFERVNFKAASGIALSIAGGLCDNSTDNSPAFTRAIDYLASVGGGAIYLEPGICRHTQPIAISKSNVEIIGSGTSTIHDGGSGDDGGTILFYVGIATNDQIKFTSEGSTQRQLGGGMSNVTLDGNNQVNTSFVLRSWRGGTFKDVFVRSMLNRGFLITVNVGDLAEAKDSQRNNFENCFAFCQGAADCWHLDGDDIANASFNSFVNCGGRHLNGKGFVLGNSDNNIFKQCGAFRDPGGSGLGMELLGGTLTNGQARSNTFINWSSSGQIIARAGVDGAPSTRNQILYIDGDNGTPAPTAETGADLVWSFEDGLHFGGKLLTPVIATTIAGIESAQLASAGASLTLHSGSQNHVRMTDGTSTWALNIAGGDLRLTRLAGTGALNIGNGVDVKIGSRRWTFVSSVPVSGTWEQGDRAFNILPSVGQPKGWICVASGTPGIWVSEGSL